MTGTGGPPGNGKGLVHGAYSKQLEPAKRGRLAELAEQAGSREGLLDLLTDRAVRAVMMCEVLESYVITQKQSGISLDQIPSLKALPAFYNTAHRMISSLLQLQPAEQPGQSAELKHILEVIEKHDKDTA